MDAVPLVAGLVAAALLAPGALRSFAANGWTRANYRGAELPFPAGVVAVAASMLALGLLAVLDRAIGWDVVSVPPPVSDAGEHARAVLAATPAVTLPLGIAFLGLLDDLLDAPARGWRGHAAEVLRGGFSTGALKAAGTLALVLWALHGVGLPFGEYVLAVLLVVLTTNLFNLLDLRPGRAAKGFLLLGTGILLLTWDTLALRMVGAFAGPLLVLGLFDMRERAMLGDTGSNVLGVLAGLWLVVSLDPLGQAIALGVVLALTVYGELRSISATVERVAVLRALDRLGRPKEPDGRDPQFARER